MSAADARSDVTCAGRKAAVLSKKTQLAGVGIVFVGNPDGGLQVCVLVLQYCPACAAKPYAEIACCSVNRIAASQVSSLIPGGPAVKSGKISEGDTLITIDKIYIDTFADGSICTQRLRRKAARAHTHTYAHTYIRMRRADSMHVTRGSILLFFMQIGSHS